MVRVKVRKGSPGEEVKLREKDLYKDDKNDADLSRQ